MKYTLIVVIAFLIVVYAYTFIKHRKKRNSQTSAVKEFRKKYRKNNLQGSEQSTSQSGLTPNRNLPEGYTRYLSKYNSTVDYVDKNEFLNPDQKESKSKLF